MLLHRFMVGARVSVLADRHNTNVRPGIYTIVKQLPVTSLGCQYRAKNIMDNHERVLDEAQLHAA